MGKKHRKKNHGKVEEKTNTDKKQDEVKENKNAEKKQDEVEENKITEKKQDEVEEKKPEAQQQQQHVNQNKRKRKEFSPFGNYRNYYGYRIGEGLDEDPRFSVFKKEWFEGKDCLDIGCNSGIITIQIAKKLHCRSILGIDIDSNRVGDAYWHLRKIIKTEEAEKKRAKESGLKVAEKADGSENGVTVSSKDEEEISKGCSPVERDLSDIVSFRQENFVFSRNQQESCYDIILCLSVTKWIHLNWGDEGLITLFVKIWKLLRPGGILVLEPQPWKSYESNRQVTETTALNYRNIEIRPDQFRDVLLDKIGFRKVENLTSGGLSGSKTGFNRPIYAYHK